MSYPVPKHGWTCFHCGETFITPKEAEIHFGFTMASEPGCRIKYGAERGLLIRLREVEKELAHAWGIIHGESSEAERAMHAMSSRHFLQLQTAEELGYERGLRDGASLAARDAQEVLAGGES